MEEQLHQSSLQSALEKVADEESGAFPHLDTRPAPAPGSPDSAPVPGERSRVSDWFFTFMCMNIPIVGWIFLLRLAFGKKHADRREFARAYLFYKLLFLILSLIILTAVALIAMDMLDRLLAYMQML